MSRWAMDGNVTRRTREDEGKLAPRQRFPASTCVCGSVFRALSRPACGALSSFQESAPQAGRLTQTLRQASAFFAHGGGAADILGGADQAQGAQAYRAPGRR